MARAIVASWLSASQLPLRPLPAEMSVTREWRNPGCPPVKKAKTAACQHLDLATSNFAVQECPREPGQALPELFPVQVPFADGHLLPPTGPGLGIEFDEAAVARYPAIESGDCPQLSRPDGSFTNW